LKNHASYFQNMKFRTTKLPMSIPGLSDGALQERFPDSGP